MDKQRPKYPHITVKLTNQDGNVFNLLAIMLAALRDAKVGEEERKQFKKEATSGDYDNFLITCTKWVKVR